MEVWRSPMPLIPRALHMHRKLWCNSHVLSICVPTLARHLVWSTRVVHIYEKTGRRMPYCG
jgi:hypothetical protein